jgi:hypothetical protein
MPYSIAWLIPNEIIYIRYNETLSSEELYRCLMTVHEMMDSSPRPVIHVINDVGGVEEAMPYKDSMKAVREAGPHPRTGWTINIHEKSLIVKMGTAFGSSLFKLRYRAFDTLDEAITHLKQADETLTWQNLDKSLRVENHGY